jgi:hypothetical protein
MANGVIGVSDFPSSGSTTKYCVCGGNASTELV